MVTKKASKPTKKDLEGQIALLEKKLEHIVSTIDSAKAKAKQAEKAKPAEAKASKKPGAMPKGYVKPAAVKKSAKAKASKKSTEASKKPAEVKASKKPGAMPKGFTPKPDVPKPAENVPATNAQALEVVYRDSAMSNPFDYKAKTPGYSPSPNRYYERLHAKHGNAPTSDWNIQKASVTGYTAPSDNYFATRQRLAYHPADKRFDGFDYKVTGVEASSPPPKVQPPKVQPTEKTVPKETVPKKAKKDNLAEYEKGYLERLDQEAKRSAELAASAAELVAQRSAELAAKKESRGTLPKGF